VSHLTMPDAGFWRDKRVLLTGHTGFKGSWLALWLHRLGAKVSGVGLAPATIPSLFRLADVGGICQSTLCDVQDGGRLAAVADACRPEIVFHLAAQSLVRASYQSPLATFSTNVMGTAYVLDALRGRDEVRVAVIVTTDKVYRNREWLWPYRESDELGGHDPYSASKAASEIVVASYRDAFLSGQGIAVASARAGNVIGGGDWAEDRLIPDAVRAWRAGKPLEVRRPDSIRPWQFVLEPLAGYLVLAQKLWEKPDLAGAYNFGPDTADMSTVREVVDLARAAYGRGEVCHGTDQTGPHEAGRLALEIAKARHVLGVRPRMNLADAIGRTMSWYRDLEGGLAARALCEADISAYEEALV